MKIFTITTLNINILSKENILMDILLTLCKFLLQNNTFIIIPNIKRFKVIQIR